MAAYLIKRLLLIIPTLLGIMAINFVIIKGKLKFEMNRRAIEDAGLQASSQLLKLAILVEEES